MGLELIFEPYFFKDEFKEIYLKVNRKDKILFYLKMKQVAEIFTEEDLSKRNITVEVNKYHLNEDEEKRRKELGIVIPLRACTFNLKGQGLSPNPSKDLRNYKVISINKDENSVLLHYYKKENGPDLNFFMKIFY